MRLKVFLIIFYTSIGIAQETLPIYQDYLSDNVYLIHPAAAGVGSCGKARLTARAQWFGVKDAPQLQTASFHTRFGREDKAGYGVIFFNDKNGYHSQKVLQATYAYHLEMDNTNVFNQLSFGLSLTGTLNDVDQRAFENDPTIGQTIKSNFYFNSDVGIAYHLGGFFSYLTVKNILLTAKSSLKSERDALNLRTYAFGTGYFFGDKEKVQFEPSMMFVHKEQTSENIIDVNIKAYKKFNISQLWAALSYRYSFDGIAIENPKYFTPIVGFNYHNFMVSYTYSMQLNEHSVTNRGFHQISLGLNLMCRKPILSACPNINARLY